MLGDKLSRQEGWKEIISYDLPGWLGQYPTIVDTWWFPDEHRPKFRSVLVRVWGADETEADEFGKEATAVMVFSVLAIAWGQMQSLDMNEKQMRYHINLLDRTIDVTFSARILDIDTIVTLSQRFKDEIMVRLGEALARAGEHVQRQWSNDSSIEADLKGSINGLADLLSKFASFFQGELRTSGHKRSDKVAERRYWTDLKDTWWMDVNDLQETFEKASSAKLVMQEGVVQEE
jgi:hypothetical protein